MSFYEVEDIIDKRFYPRIQYFVKWLNYSENFNTWEPLEHLEQA